MLAVGTPVAWWLTRSPSAWKEAVAAVVALPLVLPPTVRERIALHVLEGQRAARQGLAAAAQIAIVAVGTPIDVEQIPVSASLIRIFAAH